MNNNRNNENYYNQSPGRRNSSQTAGQNTNSVKNGRRSARPHTYTPSTAAKAQNFNWVTLFAALLVLMISVGIFCTSRHMREASRVNVGTGNDSLLENETQSEDINEENQNKISVFYASAASDTIELSGSISSDYAILIDLKNNTVKAQKNPDATIFPASMTKIMTLIVAYENCKNLDDTFVMTSDITSPLFIAGASVAGFSNGEAVTIRDMLYGAILPSGADATDALAIYTAGSIEKFVEMMNRKVLEMGLSNTHFVNPSGLHDDDHYSTVHEIALILEYAMQIEECRKILSTYQYTTRPTSYHPEGLLLTSTMFSRMAGDESGVAEVLGGKTGFTNEGKHCLASFAKLSDGSEYVLVTAHAQSTYDPIYDCINVYKNIFG